MKKLHIKANRWSVTVSDGLSDYITARLIFEDRVLSSGLLISTSSGNITETKDIPYGK